MADRDSRTLDRHGLVILSAKQCYDLLESVPVGRVAVVSTGRPRIYPVNFALDGENIVFRTVEGVKWAEALAGSAVAFEIDAYDVIGHSGWSVLVTGFAEPVATTEETENLAKLRVAPWASVQATNWVRIRPETVSGRRIDHSGSGLGAQPATPELGDS